MLSFAMNKSPRLLPINGQCPNNTLQINISTPPHLYWYENWYPASHYSCTSWCFIHTPPHRILLYLFKCLKNSHRTVQCHYNSRLTEINSVFPIPFSQMQYMVRRPVQTCSYLKLLSRQKTFGISWLALISHSFLIPRSASQEVTPRIFIILFLYHRKPYFLLTSARCS